MNKFHTNSLYELDKFKNSINVENIAIYMEDPESGPDLNQL